MRGRRLRPAHTGIAVVLAAAGTLAGCTPAPQPVQLSPVQDEPFPGAPPPALHFTASGDFSASPTAAAVLSDIAATGSELHLALGDLSYGSPGEERSWCGFVTRHVGEGFPFELLAGNHESDGQNGHIDRFAECLPNRLPGLVGEYGRQYFVDVPDVDPLVRFVMISPGVPFDDGVAGYEEGSEELDWTATAIDGARDSGIPWVVVGIHKPCLSVGRYGCESGQDVMNLLVEKRVDLVLSGHEHNYSRTHLLATGVGCRRIAHDRLDEDCIADRDSAFVRGSGTVFVIAGTGGVELRDISRSEPEWGYMAAASGRNERPAWGSLEVQLTPNRLTARFNRAAGDEFSDAFAITSPGVE
jgi:Calcineurin-like phosphoesterase